MSEVISYEVVSIEQEVFDRRNEEFLDGCEIKDRFVRSIVGKTFETEEDIVAWVVENIFGISAKDNDLYGWFGDDEGILVYAWSRKDGFMDPLPEKNPRATYEWQVRVGLDVNVDDNGSTRTIRSAPMEEAYVPSPEANPFKVGDILAGTWGYSMVIPRFVQVISVSPKSVRCRELRKMGDNGFAGNGAYAEKDVFNERAVPFTSRVRWHKRNGVDEPYIDNGNCFLRKWDGKGLSYDYLD